MSRPLRIAFGSQMRVGKDTACAWLLERYGGKSLRFAEGVYDIGDLIQKYFDKPRVKDGPLLQMIGLGLREVYGKDVWVNRVESQIAANPDSNLFACDMRFPNEADMLRKHGFTLVRLTRRDRPIDRDPNHPSETSLNDYQFDLVIENDGTVEELYAKLDALVERLRIAP